MKLTDNELEMAIVAAEEMLGAGRDEHHIASALLYLYQRLDRVDRIRAAAEHNLAALRDDTRYKELVLAVEAAQRAEGQETPQ